MLSIEIGHILAKDFWGMEHRQAIVFFKQLNYQGYLCLMVDNYNYAQKKFNLQEINQSFNQEDLILHILFYESSLVARATELLNQIDSTLVVTQGQNKYLQTEHGLIEIWRGTKYSCAWLTTVWYLARLNILEIGLPPAQGIVNILPYKYQTVEKKVQDIVKTLYPEQLINMQWFFY